jgi:glycosyltransferase involved in cell wall biosynthesis
LVIGQLTIGGAEGQLLSLVRRLDRSRFEPIVYALADQAGTLLDSIQSSGAAVRVVGRVGLPRARRLAALLREDDVRLVHSWLFIANTYAWVARSLGHRVPLISSARNCKSQGWIHHAGNVAAFRASRAIVVNSSEVGEFVARRYAAPRKRLVVVYNGVDTDRFRPREAHPRDVLTVLGAGRLVRQKDPELFVAAAARLNASHPNTRFVFLGDGPLKERIDALIERLGLRDVVELPGERSDVERYFAAADLFWLTSRWEGLPNVVLEAMACAAPVIATDVGGTRELFTSGHEGFLVRPGNAEEIAHYSSALLCDERLRHRMGRQARARAEQFSLHRMVSRTEALYLQAMQ